MLPHNNQQIQIENNEFKQHIQQRVTTIINYNTKTQTRTKREFIKTKKTGTTQTNTTQKNRNKAQINVCKTTTTIIKKDKLQLKETQQSTSSPEHGIKLEILC